MKYHDFVAQMCECVQKKAGEEVNVKTCRVLKNNNVYYEGLTIEAQGNPYAPSIYLEDFFKEYQEKEKTQEQIVDEVLSIYQRSKVVKKMNVDFLSDYGEAKKCIAAKLINFRRNEALLKTVPHIRFLDLALVFYCSLDSPMLGKATVLIHQNHVDMWGVDQDMLYQTAMENTLRMMPPLLGCMERMMVEFFHDSDPASGHPLKANSFDEQFYEAFLAQIKSEVRSVHSLTPMYILTNQDKFQGAVYIYYDEILKSLAEGLEDDFYVLPSSIHECIILPRQHASEPKLLSRMVRDINKDHVLKEEVLSNQIYLYDRACKTLVRTAPE